MRIWPGVFALLALGCSGQSSSDISDNRTPEVLSTRTFELVVDSDRQELVAPVAIRVMPADRFAVLDAALNRVVLFGTDGSGIRHFGGEGDGPGEWRDAVGLDFADDVLVVFHRDHLAVNIYTEEGDFIDRATFPPHYRFGSSRLLADGVLILSTNGHEDALVVLAPIGDIGNPLRKIGEPVIPPSAAGRYDMERTRIEISEGTIPEAIANQVLVTGTHTMTFLLMNALGELRRYDASGDWVWSRNLPEAMREPIRTRAIEENKQLSHAYWAINYALRVRLHDEKVFVLGHISHIMGSPDPAPAQHIAVYDVHGSLLSFHRIENEAGEMVILYDFDVLPDGTLLAADPMNAHIWRVKIPK